MFTVPAVRAPAPIVRSTRPPTVSTVTRIFASRASLNETRRALWPTRTKPSVSSSANGRSIVELRPRSSVAATVNRYRPSGAGAPAASVPFHVTLYSPGCRAPAASARVAPSGPTRFTETDDGRIRDRPLSGRIRRTVQQTAVERDGRRATGIEREPGDAAARDEREREIHVREPDAPSGTAPVDGDHHDPAVGTLPDRRAGIAPVQLGVRQRLTRVRDR